MARTSLWLIIVAIKLVSNVIAVPEDPHITPAPVLRARASEQNKAIVPTASGQIGVNPVSSELGSPDDYLLTNLGPDNPLVTYNGQTYQYIEKHTGYLSLEIKTTSVSNKPTTTTESVKVSVETGAAGGVGLVFSEDLAALLRTTADSAISACGITKRSSIVPRADSISCLIDQAVKASGENGVLDAAGTDAFWETIAVDVAANAPEYLMNAVAVLKSQAQKKKALIILSAMIVGTKVAGNIAAVNLPKQGVGHSSSDSNNQKCDASAEANKDSPLCSDSTCKGTNDSPKCTVDPQKGCPCLLLGTDQPPQVKDQSWWDQQQAIFASFAANPNLLGTAAPSCFLNGDGNAFDGKPAATPASWCVCETSGTKRIYHTIEKTSAPCSYSTLPTATISPKVTQSSGGKVTSCRQETLSANTASGISGGPYCTCNDNSMYPVATWTNQGSATTGCQATSTSASNAPASTPRPEISQVCTPHQSPNMPFSRANAIDAINRGCDLYFSIQIPDGDKPLQLSNNQEGNVVIYSSVGWSKAGQGGCNKQGSKALSSSDCQKYLTQAVDNCDTDTTTAKYGAMPLTWNSPNGCIDFNIWAVKRT